jgi:hypothetical protein
MFCCIYFGYKEEETRQKKREKRRETEMREEKRVEWGERGERGVFLLSFLPNPLTTLSSFSLSFSLSSIFLAFGEKKEKIYLWVFVDLQLLQPQRDQIEVELQQTKCICFLFPFPPDATPLKPIYIFANPMYYLIYPNSIKIFWGEQVYVFVNLSSPFIMYLCIYLCVFVYLCICVFVYL